MNHVSRITYQKNKKKADQLLRVTCYMLRGQKGFTLIELIVSIAIITTIAGITISNFRFSEKQNALAAAADGIVNAARNAQNYTLTAKQIINSRCSQGKAPKSYIIQFTASQIQYLYAVDKCDNANLIESYTLPQKTRIKAGGYVLGSAAVANLQIKFITPFAVITASSDPNINQGTFNSFINTSITVELTDSSRSKTISIDGISGRIGE